MNSITLASMTSITPLENVMSALVSFAKLTKYFNFTSLNRALVDLLNSYPKHFYFFLVHLDGTV